MSDLLLKTKKGNRSISIEKLQSLLDAGKLKEGMKCVSIDQGASWISVRDALDSDETVDAADVDLGEELDLVASPKTRSAKKSKKEKRKIAKSNRRNSTRKSEEEEPKSSPILIVFGGGFLLAILGLFGYGFVSCMMKDPAGTIADICKWALQPDVLGILIVSFGLVLPSSLWVWVDATSIMKDIPLSARKRISGSAPNPSMWFGSCLLLWIIYFPMYLMKRARYMEYQDRQSDDEDEYDEDTEDNTEAKAQTARRGNSHGRTRRNARRTLSEPTLNFGRVLLCICLPPFAVTDQGCGVVLLVWIGTLFLFRFLCRPRLW